MIGIQSDLSGEKNEVFYVWNQFGTAMATTRVAAHLRAAALS